MPLTVVFTPLFKFVNQNATFSTRTESDAVPLKTEAFVRLLGFGEAIATDGFDVSRVNESWTTLLVTETKELAAMTE